MTRMRLLAALPAAALLTLSLAACGGSDSGSTAPDTSSSSTAASTAITKADFLTKGNAICQQGSDDIDAAGAELAPGDAAALADFVKTVVLPNVSDQIDQLKALGYPDGDQATLDGIYSSAETIITSLGTDPSPLLTAQSDDDSPFADVNKQLVDYGLTACGT